MPLSSFAETLKDVDWQNDYAEGASRSGTYGSRELLGAPSDRASIKSPSRVEILRVLPLQHLEDRQAAVDRKRLQWPFLRWTFWLRVLEEVLGGVRDTSGANSAGLTHYGRKCVSMACSGKQETYGGTERP